MRIKSNVPELDFMTLVALLYCRFVNNFRCKNL